MTLYLLISTAFYLATPFSNEKPGRKSGKYLLVGHYHPALRYFPAFMFDWFIAATALDLYLGNVAQSEAFGMKVGALVAGGLITLYLGRTSIRVSEQFVEKVTLFGKTVMYFHKITKFEMGDVDGNLRTSLYSGNDKMTFNDGILGYGEINRAIRERCVNAEKAFT